MNSILVSPSSFGKVNKAPLEMLQKHFKVIENPYGQKLTKEQTSYLLKGVCGLLAGVEILDREILENSSLKVISRCGSGLSNIDLKAAKDLNIEIVSTPEAPVESVVEMTIAGILNVLKNMSLMNHDLHRGVWKKRIGRELKGKTVLIVGFGRIGKRLANILEVFHVNILVSDPELKTSPYQCVDLYEGLQQSDIVVLHANANKCLLDRKALNCCNGSFIFNAARGILIDELALIDSIKSGKVIGAWIDVFEEEPYCGDFINYPEIILSPHASTYTVECRQLMESQSAFNLIKVLL